MVNVKSDISGVVVTALVKAGDDVKDGQDLFILESMKMEIPIQSQSDGKVLEVKVAEGDFVNEGQLVAVLE